MKTFTAQVRVGEQLYGNGVGRSKKEAEQAAAETAYGELAGDARRRRPRVDRRRRAPPPTTDRPTAVPELPEVEVVRAASSATSSAAPSTRSRCSTRVRYAATSRGPAGFAAALTGRRFEAARRRGKYLWLPLDNGDALLGHLGMSGQLLVQPPGAPDERHLRVRFALDGADDGRELRFVDQRMFGGLSVSDGRRRAAARDRPHRPRPARPGVRRRRVRAPGPPPHVRHQAAAARPDPGLRRRQHLRRRGAVARPAARRAAGRPAAPRPQVRRAARRGPRGDGRGARRRAARRFDALYVNVNGESGYFDRSLHAYGREGEPVRPLRHADPAGRVHEPLVVLLPALPAGAAGAQDARSGVDREIDPRPTEVSLLKTAPSITAGPPRRKAHHMAKALIGHLQRPRPPPPAGRRERSAAGQGRRAGGAGHPVDGGERPARRRSGGRGCSTSIPSTWRCSRPDPRGSRLTPPATPSDHGSQQVATPYRRLRTASAPAPLSGRGARSSRAPPAYADGRVEIASLRTLRAV